MTETGEGRWHLVHGDAGVQFCACPSGFKHEDVFGHTLEQGEARLNALEAELVETRDSRDGFACDLDAAEDKVARLEAENAALRRRLETNKNIKLEEMRENVRKAEAERASWQQSYQQSCFTIAALEAERDRLNLETTH